jgi:hypothetical protein
MDQIHQWNEMLKNAVGQSIIGLHHDYDRKILGVVLERCTLRFTDCSLIYDFGVMGGVLKLAEIYEGDFSQLVQLKERGIDAYSYEYCILSQSVDSYAMPGKISIAFKGMILELEEE